MSVVTRQKTASFAPSSDLTEEIPLQALPDPDPEICSTAAPSAAGSSQPAAALPNQAALISGIITALLPELKEQVAALVQGPSVLSYQSSQDSFDPSRIQHDTHKAVLPRPAYLRDCVKLVPFGDLPSKVQSKLPEAHTRHEFSVLYTVASWGFDSRDFIEALLAATSELPPEQALIFYQEGLSSLLQVQTDVLRLLSHRLEALQHTGATRQLLSQSLDPDQEFLILTDQTAELLADVAKSRFKATLSQAKQQSPSTKSDEQLAEKFARRHHRRPAKTQDQRNNARPAVPQQQTQAPTRASSQDRSVRGRSREPAPSSRPASGGQQQSGP